MLTSYGQRYTFFFSYGQQLLAILCGSISLFLFLSLYSYHSHDPSWFFHSNAQTIPLNWCGIVGAHSAALLFYCLGDAAFVIVVLGFFLSYLMARGTDSLQENGIRIGIAFLVPLFVSSLLFFHTVTPLVSLVPGGAWSQIFVTFLYSWIDRIGTGLLLYAFMSAALVIFVPFSLVDALINMIHAFRSGISIVGMRYFLPSIVRGLSFCRACLHMMWLRVRTSQASHMAHENKEFNMQDADEQRVVHYSTQDESRYESREFDHLSPHSTSYDSTSYDGEKNSEIVPETNKYQSTSYSLPSALLLKQQAVTSSHTQGPSHDLSLRAQILEKKLELFGVTGKVISVKHGPVVSLFEYNPTPDIKISRILALEDDLALALRAMSIRIIAPIPGKSVVGFEVANEHREHVLFGSIASSEQYTAFAGELPLILGQDTIGTPVIADLVGMPHLLIAGSTGSGKSVALNAMLIGLLYKCSPSQVRFILIDPKRIEFSLYADIAHLLFPIVADVRKVPAILRWVVREMEERYAMMAERGARNIADYNKLAPEHMLTRIVVVIDELADLMMTIGREIEELLARIAQMARAAGIHMIVATQRPSVDVVTGLIKVNFPSRIALRVTSKVDSRTILDCAGADRLLGAGDMLFFDSKMAMLRRVHGAYISGEEVEKVVAHVRAQKLPAYEELLYESEKNDGELPDEDKQLYAQVIEFMKDIDEISISLLQRRFNIGYNRSARLVDILEVRGLIMPSGDGKMRKVIK